eukprot:COSAG05_NODE_2256_length_3329_cov_2.630031_5_plen_120_part_00
MDVPEVPATGVDPGEVEEAEPQFADETEPNAESWMEPTETTITIDGMSTKAIKAELKRRALSTTGKVAALKQRLKDAVGGNTFVLKTAAANGDKNVPMKGVDYRPFPRSRPSPITADSR